MVTSNLLATRELLGVCDDGVWNVLPGETVTQEEAACAIEFNGLDVCWNC